MTNSELLVMFHRIVEASPSRRTLFEATLVEANARRLHCYLVGGAVRDLIRGHWSDSHSNAAADHDIDIDIACEGDAIALARAVTDRLGATLHTHSNFGTATLELGDYRIDLARTRREHYLRAGALPEVEPAGIDADLARRDFTVNAMALSLTTELGEDGETEPQAGTVVDHFGGVRDLERGLIRILHDSSFQDDPTRLIRACRYAARLKGRFAPATSRAARRDIEFLGRLSNGRFGDAWRLLIADPAASGALVQARRLRISQTWLPGWQVTRILAAHQNPALARHWNVEPAQFYWALTGLSAAGAAPLDEIPQRCALTKAERRALDAGGALRAAKSGLGRRSAPLSRIVATLRREPAAATAAASVLWRGVAGHRSEAFVDTWQYVRSPLSAPRLIELGVVPGPALGGWLDALRNAVLDGNLPPDGSAEAERWIQSRRRLPPSPRGSRAKPEKETEP